MFVGFFCFLLVVHFLCAFGFVCGLCLFFGGKGFMKV